MNDNRLEALLEEKRNSRPVFAKTGEEFADEFFRKVHSLPEKRRFRRISWMAWAAGLFLVCGLTALLVSPHTETNRCGSVADRYGRLKESVRLFGNRATVFFFGDELVTGERDAESDPKNLVNIDLTGEDGNTLRLSLACSDDDSIRLDSDTATGMVVVSRCDAGTLVIDLEIDYEGRAIHTAIPVRKCNGKAYYGTAEGS